MFAPISRSLAVVVATVPLFARGGSALRCDGDIERIHRVKSAVFGYTNVRSICSNRECDSDSICASSRAEMLLA